MQSVQTFSRDIMMMQSLRVVPQATKVPSLLRPSSLAILPLTARRSLR